MDKHTGQMMDAYSSISFQCSQGFEVLGTPLHLAQHRITFEVVTPCMVLRTSEVLSKFRVQLSNCTAYYGRATVANLTQAGTLTVCEASLDESWVMPQPAAMGVHAMQLSDKFDGFVDYWQKFYLVESEFKVVVADMQTFLTDLRLWLEQIELGGLGAGASSDSRQQLEHQIAMSLGRRTTPILNTFFEKFERLAAEVEPERRPAYRIFARRQLHALLLCAPFLYRTFVKPLGYAGDYEMVNMIAGNPVEGGSLFAKLVNLWFLEQPPAEAHRNRIEYLEQCLHEVTVRAMEEGRKARILNLGCGPAQEVQRFLQDRHHSDHAEFTLLDFNEETIDCTRALIDKIKLQHHRKTHIQFTKKSVNTVLKESARIEEHPIGDQYDFVYCAGLFDYLTDQVCKRLSSSLYGQVRPGGLFVTTNVHVSNPWPLVMDFIMDWHLIYRTSAQMMAIRPEAAVTEMCRVTTDPSGVNIYFEARKPELNQHGSG